MKLELRYLVEDVDRHGNVRVYLRRNGRKVRLRSPTGSPEFFAEYRAALAALESPLPSPTPRSTEAPLPGTLRWLCAAYFGSAEFKRLDPRTQRVRRLILEHCLREPVAPAETALFSEFPLSRLTPAAIRVLRDRKAAAPETANGRVKALRQVFAWGMASHPDLLPGNPARDVPYFRSASQGHHSWTLEEVTQYEARHPVGSKARLALALLLYTGQRRSDVVRFGRQHVRDGWLHFTQAKNRNRAPVRMALPVLPELQRIIDASPSGDLTFIVTAFGRPFTANGFGNWFRDRCDEAGLEHCSAHGLRKAGAALAAENGATESELMAIFCWSTLKEAARYTKAARQKLLAASAVRLLRRHGEPEAALTREQNGVESVPLSSRKKSGGTNRGKK